MNLINIKKIIFAVIVCLAILMTAYTVLQIFNKPNIKEINIPNIKDIEFTSSIDTSSNIDVSSNDINFDYQVTGLVKLISLLF